ncbi:LOW QUALITY PROTEIN: uncharacterized protein LOC108890839 [Lates calcarifer]|uniref:LOW QUALITY PROTEIN: uncharacterized protein LOC108890839 n=1 Tax=Lates calcarifer TaxID=8187 RepID=A0AAJ7VAA7_LATCA|nr:LOW QUALITY PROTEIN: uncharacterized protein LOC108890839 [Lates calcarifer]
MPRNYTRKTRWGLTPIEEMKRAVSDVKGQQWSIRSVAKERNIDRSTLQRYIKKSEEKEVKMTGYMGTAEANRIFPLELEKELADHIKKLAEQFHGLTQKKCRELASELAERNNIPTPSNWTEKGLAGRMCKKQQQHHGILHLDSDPLGSCLTTEVSSPMQSLSHPWCQTGPTWSSRLQLQMMHPWFQPLFLPSYLHQALHSHVLHKVTQIHTQALLDMCLLL